MKIHEFLCEGQKTLRYSCTHKLVFLIVLDSIILRGVSNTLLHFFIRLCRCT